MTFRPVNQCHGFISSRRVGRRLKEAVVRHGSATTCGSRTTHWALQCHGRHRVHPSASRRATRFSVHGSILGLQAGSLLSSGLAQHWVDTGRHRGSTWLAMDSNYQSESHYFITAPWAYYSARSSTLERNTEEAHSSQRIQVFMSSRSHSYSFGLSHDIGDGIHVGTNFCESF